MNRLLAVLICITLFGLVVITALTDQVPGRADFDSDLVWVHFISQICLAFGLLLYCGYAALHAVQRIESPAERSLWMITTLALNALGSCYYYCTVYQRYRKQGLGRLITRNEIKNTESEQRR
jgi:hypothetical protein